MHTDLNTLKCLTIFSIILQMSLPFDSCEEAVGCLHSKEVGTGEARTASLVG